MDGMTGVSARSRLGTTAATGGTALIAVALVLVGIWAAGGVVTDDFRTSMALTAVWFVIVAAGSAVLWTRRPSLRTAAVAAVATFVLVGGYLGYTSMRDRTVDETLTAGSALAQGSFRSVAHETTGTARIVETAAGRSLTLSAFRTDPGPDLFVYLVPGTTPSEDVDGGVQLARLKGNVGNQEYVVPADLDLAAGASVVIWCRSFSVAFGVAQLSSVPS
jgi:hypothetical protein